VKDTFVPAILDYLEQGKAFGSGMSPGSAGIAGIAAVPAIL
jgi:hypothetical protein